MTAPGHGAAVLRIATRGSEQARVQAGHVAALITSATGRHVELVLVETTGDKVRDRPIWEIGGRGVFTKEVQAAVLDGRADLAVHSAKDLPSSWITDGLVLAAVPERGDPRDALAGRPLDHLHQGATVATGSVRRRTQLAHRRPDLHFVGLRGNIPTRIARARPAGQAATADDGLADAIVVAVAGATWVGLGAHLVQRFGVDEMVPQVGQGALAIECRVDDDETRAVATAIEHAASRRCVDAERSFLARLGGGCDLPVGAHAVLDAHGRLHVTGLIASADGATVLRDAAEGDDIDIGARLADRLLVEGDRLLGR